MDPVSSALGILGFVGAVVRQIDKYYETYREFPSRAKRFSASYKLKEPLIKRAMEYIFYDESIASNKEFLQIFQHLEGEVKDLEKRLADKPQKGFRAKLQRLRDRLSIEDVNKTLTKLSEYCEDMNRHVNLISMIEAIKVKNDRVIHWISDYPFDARRQDMYRLYHQETLKWVFKRSEFKAWADDLQDEVPSATFSQRPVLWFKGEPGVGKSVMASLIASRLKAAHSKGGKFCLLYFFFHFQQKDQQQAEHVFRSLARQAVQESIIFSPSLPISVVQIYNNHNGGNSGSLSQGEAIKLLETLLPGFDRSYIIIDGLDEYEQRLDAYENVPTALLRLAGDPNNKTRLMVTSRHSCRNLVHVKEFDEIVMGASKDDMKVYLERSIDDSLAVICQKLSTDPVVKKKVVDEILERSANQFQLANRGFELLNKSESYTDFFQSIRNISDQVYDSYQDSIKRIDNHHHDTTDTRRWEPMGIRALAFVLHAQERLTGLQLQHLLAMRPGKTSLDVDALPEPEYIVRSTLGLVSYTESGHFQFSHKTVAEFLHSPQQAERFNNLQIVLAQNLYAYKSLSQNSSAKDYPLIQYCDNYLLHHLLSYFYRKVYPYAEEPIVQKAVAKCMEADFEKSQQETWLKDQWKGDLTKLHYAAIIGAEDLIYPIMRNDGISIDSQDSLGYTALHVACMWRRTAMIRALLVNQANIHARTAQGQTPLHIGCKMGYTEVINMLISRNADCNATDGDGLTALHYAIRDGRMDVVNLLLNIPKIEVDAVDIERNTPFTEAVRLDNHGAIERLLESGANINHKGYQGLTALMYAAKFNNTNVGQMLIDKGSELDQQDDYGWTALHAARNGHDEYVKMLISNGAEIDVADNEKETPIMLFNSSYHGWVDMGALVLKHGCPVNHTCHRGRTALHYAAMYGNDDYVKMLLGHGAEVYVEDEEKETPLWLAVCYDRRSTIDILLSHGARMSHINKAGESMLFNSARHGWVDTGKLVVEKGEDVHHRDSNFETVLFVACAYNAVEYAEMLIDVGAEVDVKNRKDETPLLLSCRDGCADIVEMLIRRGANIHTLDKDGRSLFGNAVAKGHLDVLKVLVDGGVDIHEKDGDGQTALHQAVSENRAEMVEYLLQKGLDPTLVDSRAQTSFDKAGTVEMRRLLKTYTTESD
ncbi:hypothetical protein TD95_001515 [Thielaviopsis punctulata]|uniref:NACHT domain-containing protein n=1 Tax=Thielaviopsis punctulata TaxID=72032 RepID=A0A0F4ZII9_9PEZI|nr:hypothetical protein TD95_001515 [Thielaviopsis punctulata]